MHRLRFPPLLGLLLTSVLCLQANAAEQGPFPAFAFGDVDPALSGVIVGGERTALTEQQFRAYFQPATPKSPAFKEKRVRGAHVLLAFRKPVEIGTATFGHGSTGERDASVHVLNADFEGAIAKATDADWREVADVQTFPEKSRTRAVRLTFHRDQQQPLQWLAWKDRWTNLTPTAVGSGEKAPFGAHPNAIPQGQTWINTSNDPRPGAPKQVQRARVSETIPSWYVLSWDAPRQVDGLWLSCNADQFAVYAYRGEPELNPALAPRESWRRIEYDLVHEQLRGDQLHDRWLSFTTLKTIALKVELTDCHRSPIAKIGRMAAFSAAPLANTEATTATTPGKAIRFEQPFDGQLAVVVTDEAGRLVRNLVAQVDRRRGPNVESWDLRDETGLMVPPGKYRWKAITSPPLGLRYQTTVYPNAPQLFPGQTPWLTGEAGPNGWLADHAPITSGATTGDRVYFGAPGVEGGVCLIECDLTGRKQWAKHNFGPFSGVGRLAGDAQHLFIQERDALHRLDPKTHALERIATLGSAERQGHIVGMAAHQGMVALSMNAPEPWVDNATRADVVDLDHCWPKFAARIPDPLGNRRVEPMPRVDFLRLLRLTGTPAGQNGVSEKQRETHFPITIDTVGKGKHQYVVLAFKEPVPLGSVVLPNLDKAFVVDLAVLKPNADYPPNPDDDSQWLATAEKPVAGKWTCVAMPTQTRTRGLRLRVRRAKDAADDNSIDDLLSKPADKKAGPKDIDLDKPTTGDEPSLLGESPVKDDWFASFEGLKLLRRRFTDRTPQAKIRVNSGEINAAGEWDSMRSEPLSTENPGTYVMEWSRPTKVAALAIKEIDGAVTEIDIWDDKAGDVGQGEVPLKDAPGWKHVATYKQARRDGYEPAFERNDWARYLDGYVSLGGEVSTRAVRLRVTEQWTNLGDRGTATQRFDRGRRELDRRRCRIYGVAALSYLGDEAPLDTLAYRRIELRDGATGKLVREFTANSGGVTAGDSPHSLAYGADGALFGIQAGRIVQINTQGGKVQALIDDIDGQKRSAQRLAIGADGTFYVFVAPERNVRAYDRDGRYQRSVGKPGGQVPGPWDAEKFRQVEELVVDAKNQLWVVESQDAPRRIVHYDDKGRLVHELYGNTGYGGGGVLDAADNTRLFYKNLEFAIDWKTGTSRVKNMLAEWMPDDCMPTRYQGRTYLVTTPLSVNPTQPVVFVHLYDEQRGTATRVAAFGEVDAFDALQVPAVLKKLDSSKSPKDYTFVWSDLNEDALVDPDEVTFEPKAAGEQRLRLGRLNRELHCWSGARKYAPTKVLASGVPVFEATTEARSGVFELNEGKVLALGAQPMDPVQPGDGDVSENRVVDGKGQVLWRYPTSYNGVSGLYLPPWHPGYVTNEFGVIGHETASAGDLGEFVVVHGNNGTWKIWTADGLLAGQVLRHKFDPRSIVDTSRPTVKRGDAFDNLTAGQEHFHGCFVKSSDGKYYVVHGHNYIGLWEVEGLDRFQRLSGEITVTPEDVRLVRSQQEELARREVKSQAKLLDCLKIKSGGDLPVAAEMDGAQFSIGYDERSLYVRWQVANHGALRNSGSDFHRYFKTGACLDLQLGVDEAAPGSRKTPAIGDLRLLFTVVDGKPQAVLYQPTIKGATGKDAWETRTDAGGTVRFDRVVRLTKAQLTYAPDQSNASDRYAFTAVIPLRELGLEPRPGALLRCDWGLLTSDDGHTVKRRIYWSNTLANGTTDEAWEARLDPHLWGTLAIREKSRADAQIEQASPDSKQKPSAAADIVDDILNDLDAKKK
jgi:hypothetical protein